LGKLLFAVTNAGVSGSKLSLSDGNFGWRVTKLVGAGDNLVSVRPSLPAATS